VTGWLAVQVYLHVGTIVGVNTRYMAGGSGFNSKPVVLVLAFTCQQQTGVRDQRFQNRTRIPLWNGWNSAKATVSPDTTEGNLYFLIRQHSIKLHGTQ
jgi:hypothetical protein